MCDKNNKSVPITHTHNSSKLKNVSCLTLAAEMLALADGCDTILFTQSLLKENIFTTSSCHFNIQAFTDNQSLHDAVKTTNLTLDRYLRVELSALTDMHDRNKITVNWIANKRQLSDSLTKKGVISVLNRGNPNWQGVKTLSWYQYPNPQI